MAETYRGLTIRIGGDTTALTKALKYSNGAISQTQVELTKLAQALKMDPTNVQVYNTHLSYMGQQASNTAAKLAQLRDAQERVANEHIQIVDQGAVKEAATTFDEFVQKYRDGSANIAADTQSVKRVLDSYTEQLRKVYNEVTGYVEKANGLETDKLTAAFELAMTPAEKLGDKVAEIKERFSTLPDGMDRSEESVEKLMKKVEELSGSFGKFFNEDKLTFDFKSFYKALDDFKAKTEGVFSVARSDAQEMAASINAYVTRSKTTLENMGKLDDSSAIAKMSENIVNYITKMLGSVDLLSEKFNNANQNVSLDHIEEVLSSLAEEMGMSEDQILDFLGELEELKSGFKEADTEYKNMLNAEQLIDLEVEIQKTEAQFQSMARAMADLNVPDAISRTLLYIQENVNALSDSFRQLIATASDMSTIISQSGQMSVNVDFGDPTSNVHAFEVALRSLVESEQTVEEGLAAIRREMDEFAGNGVFLEDVTDSTKSATQQLYDAKDALADANAEANSLTGTVEMLSSTLEALKAMGDLTSQSLIVGHDSNEFTDATKEVIDYITAVEKVEDQEMRRLEEIDKHEKKLAELRGSLDETGKHYVNLATAEQKVKDAQQAFEDAKMRAALEQLQTDLVNTQNQTLKVDAAIRKLAESMTQQMTTNFSAMLFGDSDKQLKSMSDSFDNAIERAKTFKKLSEEMPKSVETSAKKTEAFADAIKVGEAYVQELRNQLANIDLSGAEDDIAALKEEFGSAQAAVEGLTQEASSLNTKLVQLSAQRDLAPEGSERWVELNAEIKDIEDALEDVRGVLNGVAGDDAGAIMIARAEKLSDELEKAEATLANLKSGKLPEGGSSGDSAAFEQALSRIVQYAERIGGAVIESANTIDSAYRDMRKTVEGTEAQFKSLKDAAIEFSQTHAVSSDTLLEMEALGGQLGVAVDELGEFGEVASNLDIATDIDAETIALQLGQISNVMDDLDGAKFDQFGDALVRLGNNMAAQESSIMNVAQRMSSVANVAGMSAPDLLAWSAAIASTGQRSESAATAISNTMTGISAAVAKGGDTLNSFAGIAKMSAQDFATAWQNNPTEALKAFIEGLESLNDTNTGAIAALEEMGISSVRQETALLGLASTVDVLDNALTMSNDAFNGVSDKWGDAGDAAIEAQRKSEGFSGSLTILKNNTANLAESLGNSLVLPMQVASEAIAGLTTFLNALPGPVKDVVIGFTGFTAVGALALEAVDKLKKGFKDLGDLKAGSAIKEIADKLADLIPALEKGSTLAAALGTGLALGGVVLAAAAIGEIVQALADAKKKAEEYESAQNRLTEAGERLEKATDGATGAQKSFGDALDVVKEKAKDTVEYINEIADREDALAERMENRNFELDFDLSRVEAAREKIDELANSSKNLTYEQRMELQDAINEVNDVMGTSLTLYDSVNGLIKEEGSEASLTTQQLDELIDKQTNGMKGKAAFDNMTDSAKEYHRAISDVNEYENKMEERRKALTELYKEYSDTLDNVSTTQGGLNGVTKLTLDQYIEQDAEMQKLKENYNTAQQAVKDFESTQDGAADTAKEFGSEEAAAAEAANAAMVKALGTLPALTETLNVDAGANIRNLADHLLDLGITTEDLADLTDYQLSKIGSAYDGTIKSVEDVLKQLGISFGETSDQISDAAEDAADSLAASAEQIEAVKKVQDAMYDKVKADYDKESEALKASNDRKYTETKRGLDAQYDIVKRGLDQQYDEHKRKLDAEYDAMKTDFDRKYDLKKKEYDKQYELEKSSRDKEYDNLKKDLDRAYNEEKRSRDNAYNQLKKDLDARYKLEKEARDRQYEEYKKVLDAQYDAQKKSLDAEYDQLKKSLDEQYKARKKALDNAYSDRKKSLDKEYKEAQKASKKYLEQYKKDQKAEVDAFKKATDTRVAQMKRELDEKKKLINADKERKTGDIDKRIAALKGETEAEENAQKEREEQEKLSELRKNVEKAKSRRTRAEAEKAYNDYLAEIEMEAAKERREAMIEQLEQEKEIVETDADERIAKVEEQYDAEIEAYKTSRDLQLQVLQEHLNAMYEAEQEAENLKLEQRKERNDAELASIKERNDAELETMKENQALQLEQRKAANEAMLASAKERNDAELEAMKSAHEVELEQIKLDNDAELEAMKYAHEQELQDIKDTNAQKLADRKETYTQELAAIQESNANQLQAYKDGQEQELAAKNLAHEQELQKMKYDNEEILKQKKYDIEDYLKVVQGQYDGELKKMNDAHEASLKSLQEYHTQLLEKMRTGQVEVDSVLDTGVQSVDTKAKEAEKAFDTGTAPMAEHGKKNAENGMKSLWNTINENSGNVGFAVKEGPVKAASDEMSLLPDVFKKSAEKSVSDYAGTVKGAKDVASSTKHLRDTATKEANKTKDDFGKAADVGAKEYGKKLKGSNEGKEGANKLKKSATGALESFPNEAGKIGTEGAKKFMESFGSYDATGSVTNIVNKMVNNLNSRTEDFRIVGHNFAVGMINGTNEVNLPQRAYELAIETLNQMKAGLDEHSPSRKTMEIGRYFVQGAEIGIEQESSRLERQTRLLAQSMADGITPTLDAKRFKDKSAKFLFEYRGVLKEMLAIAGRNADGISSVSNALDSDRLRTAANKYLSECRKSVDEVLAAAETYARSADEFDASFDVASFRESASQYASTYRETIDDVIKMMLDYNKISEHNGSGTLVSSFDIDELRRESEGFMAEYARAIDNVEAIAREHIDGVGTFDAEFDTTALNARVGTFTNAYQDAISTLDGMAREHVDNSATFDTEFNLQSVRERSQAYLNEYRQVLAALSEYARQYSEQVGGYDVGGLGDGVTIGTDIMTSILDGMRRMEGELSEQVARLVNVIEDGFDPTLDISSMNFSASRMLSSMGASMDSMVGEWKRGAADMRAAQAALVADVTSEQAALARRITVVVEGGFGDKRLAAQVTEFLDDTVQAAYEAIDRINSRMRNSAAEIAAMQAEAFGRTQYVAMAQSAQPATVNINVTLTDVTIRETADIDRLAQALAQRTNQIMRSRIG